MKGRIEWNIGCCWEGGTGHVNGCSLSIQQMNRNGAELMLILMCKGHAGGCGEEAGGYVAERLTEWFYQEFAPHCDRRDRLAGGRKWMAKSLVHCFSALHEEIAAFEGRRAVAKRGGVSIELLAIQDKSLCYAHAGEGRCYRLRGKKCVLMQKPHIAGRNIVLRTVGHGIFMPPDIHFARLGRQEGFVVGENWFFQGCRETELRRVFSPSTIRADKVAELRMKELYQKMCRSYGKRAAAAAVGIFHS